MRAFDTQLKTNSAARQVPTSSFSPAPALDVLRGLTGPELVQMQQSDRRARLIFAGVIAALVLGVAGIAYGATRPVVDERIRRYPTGVPMVHAYYIGGARQGDYTSFYRSGNMKATGRYKNDKRTGMWRTFYSTTQLRAFGPYKADRQVGEWRFFFANGNLARVESYDDDGHLQGKSQVYFENGNLEHEMTHVGGVFHGVERIYAENGQLQSEVTLNNGVTDGKAAYFYADGTPFMSGVYVKGERHGPWTLTDVETGVTEVFEYDNGWLVDRFGNVDND